MTARTVSICLMLVFLLLIAAPLVMFPDLPNPGWRTAHLPQHDDPLSIRTLKMIEFPAAFADYFSNHHLMHDRLVDVFRTLKQHAARDTIFPNVLIGEEDWLYYTGENNIRDHECTFMFNADELARIRENLTAWNAQLSADGIHFYVVIAPNKETIYPQYLPEQVDGAMGVCRIDQVAALLTGTDLKVLDLRTTLIEGAQIKQVYHRTDTHWNDSGALLATGEIMRLIKQDFPEVSVPAPEDYTEINQRFSGDLAAFLAPDARFIEQAVMLEPKLGVRAKYEQGENRTITTQIEGSDSLRTVIFRDSFSDALVPFLAEQFSNAFFIHSFQIDTDLVKDFEANVVILEVAQRYLVNLR